MSYTLEQKREALERNELWVRYPSSRFERERIWERVDPLAKTITQYLRHRSGLYFIGPTPPRVLSELEGELANVLGNLFALVMGECRQLLDEDSGGDSDLYMQITDVLEKTKAQQ